MNQDNMLLNEILNKLLNEELSEQEVQSLKDEGFKIEVPIKKTAVAAALYKKATSGDLSAIKELRSIMAENEAVKKGDNEDDGGAVIIVDDIKN